MFLLEKNLYGFSVEGLQLKETVQKGFSKGWIREITSLGILVRASSARLFCDPWTWTTSIWLRKKYALDLFWKVLMKEFDLERPTSVLDQITGSALRMSAIRKEDSTTGTQDWLISLIAAGAVEELLCTGDVNAQNSVRSYDHCRTCEEIRWTWLANESIESL